MAKSDLKKLQKNTDDRNIALLAQEVSFLTEKFEDFRRQTQDDFTEVKANTSGNYGSLGVQNDHEKRITRLEKAALWVLGTTFAIVFTGVIGLVIVRGN